MKNFESTFNRWLDGSLGEAQQREFEAGLDEETLRAAKAWPGMRALLKESAGQITLPHPDFLNEQIRRRIEEKQTTPASPVVFPLRRLLWAGAFCVASAVVFTAIFLPLKNPGNTSTIVFIAETASPGASASAFQTPGDRGAVIWLEGMPYIPDEERVQ
ncbi:MAG: hypothetical protein WC076_13655 [Terrimicrobiaceae bacterium]